MYRPFLRALVVLIMCGGGTPAQQPAHRIEATDLQTVNAKVTYEIKTTSAAVATWMIFLPEPPELPSQGGVKTKTAPAGKLVAEKSPLGRPVRYIEQAVARPVAGGGISVTLDVEATLRSRKLVPLRAGEKPPDVTPLTANERKYYLAPTARVDFDARAFQRWLDAQNLRRDTSELPLDFAARVLEVIRTVFKYRYDPDEDKRASVACTVDRTDCGGMSFLFAGAMRAGGVPARVLVGRTAQPRKPGSTPADTEYDRPHVRAEFFVTGIGWVPVDPAYAQRDKRKPVTAFVGDDPGDMLVLHVDVDLQLPFPDKVREAQFLQLGPYYWTKGKGKFDGTFGPTGWDLRAAPIEKR